MKEEYRKAFSEVNEIIQLMPLELVKKIPNSLIEMMKKEKDTSYKPNIQEPIEEQSLMDETIIILGLIYRDFLVPPEKRKELQLKDAEELKRVQEEIREKYNPDNIFKKKKEIKEEKSIAVIPEQKCYQKIICFIKGILKKD